MSTGYKDGSFSSIETIEEAFKTFDEAIMAGTAKMFLVGGSEREVQEQIDEQKTKQNIEDLKRRLDLLEKRMLGGLLKIPTSEEIKHITGTVNPQ